MSANVLPFPAPSRARRRRKASDKKPAARVHAFPVGQNRTVVEFIATEMRDARSINDAEDALVQHLELEACRLERMGVRDLDEIEAALSVFARRAWAAYFRRDTNLDGAA